MIAVVVRVRAGQPPEPRNGARGGPSPARRGAPTSSRSARTSGSLASRFFFLMGGAMLVNYIITYLKQSHGLEEERGGRDQITS